ncbi:hypothetical protein Cantr_00273 [Candida viswanathii]|uniref:Uncharacterized protein n=1 Tax=Candida viswanathii TaxID=5486 RepID=A0A367YHX0_9ASCO|nr:hypothetical protein Cantr_00273 [Candida viswanathii]
MGKGRSVKVKKIQVVKQSPTSQSSTHRTTTTPSLSSTQIYNEYKRSQLLDLNAFLTDLQHFKDAQEMQDPELVLKQSWDRLKEQLTLNDNIYRLRMLEARLADVGTRSKGTRGGAVVLDTKEIEYIELRNETLEMIRPVDCMVNELLSDWKRATEEEKKGSGGRHECG